MPNSATHGATDHAAALRVSGAVLGFLGGVIIESIFVLMISHFPYNQALNPRMGMYAGCSRDGSAVFFRGIEGCHYILLTALASGGYGVTGRK